MPPFLMGPTHNVLLAHSPNTPHKALSGDSRNFLGLSPENKNFDFSKGFLTNKVQGFLDFLERKGDFLFLFLAVRCVVLR